MPFRGSLVALITPFRNGEVDEKSLRALVDLQIEGGTRGLVPCGTTGETPTLSDDEQTRVIEVVVDQARGRVPVMAGTGSNDTRKTIKYTKHAKELGADAALVVTPYYNKPTPEGVYLHFKAIAEAVDLPMVLYNIPGRTGSAVPNETIIRIAKEIPSVVGVKEATGSIDNASQIVVGAGPEFDVLSGDDSLTLPIMSVGGKGVISVLANIAPKPVAEMTDAFLAGDARRAQQIHAAVFNLCRALFIETNPIPVKTAAGMLGLCSDEVRLPLCAMSEGNRKKLAEALAACSYVRQPVGTG
jgi:4-hydroxy-tetrahydrodipicolinate synthase